MPTTDVSDMVVQITANWDKEGKITQTYSAVHIIFLKIIIIIGLKPIERGEAPRNVYNYYLWDIAYN